jgi:hypothetical protein
LGLSEFWLFFIPKGVRIIEEVEQLFNHRFISSPIFMSAESLRLRLDKQQLTKIYVDPGDIKNYFFDVRFLDDMI